jgi:nucleoid-associated protein YgaU
MGSLLKNLASPDIHHAHQVVEGDRLPTIVHSVYKDTIHYIDVAAANRLDSLRALRPGQVLQLPPVR